MGVNHNKEKHFLLFRYTLLIECLHYIPYKHAKIICVHDIHDMRDTRDTHLSQVCAVRVHMLITHIAYVTCSTYMT